VSKATAAKIQIQSFSSALELLYLDAGRYPTTAEGLIGLAKPTSGVRAWNGPYLKDGSVPNDPWGKPYVYRSPGVRAPYEITSYGLKGIDGNGAGPEVENAALNSSSAGEKERSLPACGQAPPRMATGLTSRDTPWFASRVPD
jgi:general secretion pathway protein G